MVLLEKKVFMGIFVPKREAAIREQRKLRTGTRGLIRHA
jgi:hypothetical protein